MVYTRMEKAKMKGDEMLGLMIFNDGRQAAPEFSQLAFEAATRRLGEAPARAFVKDESYLDVLKARGFKVETAPWVLPDHIYFVGSGADETR